MGFLDTIDRAKAYLGEHGRVSLRALKREFKLDDDALEELVEELVDVQAVAVREGKVIVRVGAAPPKSPTAEMAGRERAPRAYTPNHLADKILSSRSALEGERKQVTVLFADVKGSMELAEQLDPEEWHRILDRFFQILTDGVHRFEGTINQYTGDGIMALFGAPIAHEDHAQRACYAALHLRDQLRRYAEELKRTRGLGFAARIGLNSGEVVVGKIGDDLRMDYTAQGHTVGLAARMEQLADPGGVYVSQHTAGLVSGFFQLRDLGDFALRGLRESLRVYQLEGTGRLRTRLEVSRARGFTRFVGRARELQALETALSQATDGHGQVMGVVGDAGVGKSRLCLEFVESCRAKGIAVYEAHCLSHGKTVPFLPLLELLRSLFDISPRDGDREARRKVAGELTLLGDGFRDALPLVFDFLGVADPDRRVPQMDPEARQRQLHAFVRGLVQARTEPAVLLIDDLHWVDSGSDAFVAQIVEAVRGTRTMLLVNFRPEYHADWTSRSYYQQLPLVPLGPEAIGELLGELLGTDPSVAVLRELIRERTGGSPFFIEEVVQSLVEAEKLEGARGAHRFVGTVGALVVPATVQALLAARIDRLAENDKHVLQAASVVGKTFGDGMLQDVVSLPEPEVAEALRRLVGAELIYEHALYPEREYSFKHPLTQEVAYQSQLGDRRAEVHRAVARKLAEIAPEKQGEQAALIAHHWGAAGEREEAARWHRRAAQWATVRAPAEAVRHWRLLRGLVAELPESSRTRRWGAIACSQLLNQAWRQGVAPAEAAILFQEGTRMAERNGDTGLLALVTFAYATELGATGDIQAWVRHSEEALHLAEQLGSEVLQAVILTGLATGTEMRGDLHRAIELAERGIALTRGNPAAGEDLLYFSPYLLLTAARGAYLAYVGRIAEGREQLRHALQLARERADFTVISTASGWSIYLAYVSGETSGAAAHGRAAVDAARRVGLVQQVNADQWCGLAAGLEGDWSQAASTLERGASFARENAGLLMTQALVLSYLALAYARCGNPAARATAEQAVAVAQKQGALRHEIDAQLSLARVLLASGDVDECPAIDAALVRTTACMEQSGARAYLPMIMEERATLARLRGDEAASVQDLREAHRLYEEIGATGHAARLAKQLGP